MNPLSLLPLSTTALLALAAGAMNLSSNKSLSGTESQALVTQHVINLPMVKVTPHQADLAYYQASQTHRIVDLPAVKVTPDLSDLAYYQAARGAQRVITLATVSVHPAAEDLANYLSSKQRQVAGQEADVVRRGAEYLHDQVTAGALTLIHISR